MPARPAATAARPYHHGDLRRALIDAALELVTEEQDWDFSLREVARRAGVSHNAPYNHFPEKRDLLAAVAAAGFEQLRDRMREAVAGIVPADKALRACAHAYVHFGTGNPALYRLMFGPTLCAPGEKEPEVTREAGASAKAVLQEIIERGARSGAFSLSEAQQGDLEAGALAAWSQVHGITMLIIDGTIDAPRAAIDALIDRIIDLCHAGLLKR
jgi:AcrR family transcriptional regulator